MTKFHGKNAKVYFNGIEIGASSIELSTDSESDNPVDMPVNLPSETIEFTIEIKYLYDIFWSLYHGIPMVSRYHCAN